MNKPSTASNSTDDLADRMDTSNANTVFINSLSTPSSSEDEDGLDFHEGGRYVLAPDVERKIRQLPYAFLRKRAAEEGIAGGVPAPIYIKERETGMVLYKPKEQVIAESIARHVDTKASRRSRRRQLADNEELADWGDDEREDLTEADKDEDEMDID